MDMPEKIWTSQLYTHQGPHGYYWADGKTHDHDVEYIRADLVPAWQPIETAPRDGTEFLAYYPAIDGAEWFVEVTSWFPMPKAVNADSWTIGGIDPTHWKPLDTPCD